MKKKKILFASEHLPIGPEMPDWVPGLFNNPDSGSQGNTVKVAEITAEILSRRVYEWSSEGKIEPTQLSLFLKRVKIEPKVVDVKLDGNILVLSIADGTEERIKPDDGIELQEVPFVYSRPWWEKSWYWIKNHPALSIGGGVLVIAIIVLLIVKRH